MWNVTPVAISTSRQYSHEPPARATINCRRVLALAMNYRPADAGATQTVTGTAFGGAVDTSPAAKADSNFAFSTINRSASATSCFSRSRSVGEMVPSLCLSNNASIRRCLDGENFLSFGRECLVME